MTGVGHGHLPGRAQGRTGGRPTVSAEDLLTAAKARKEKGENIIAIAKALGVSRATLYRHLGQGVARALQDLCRHGGVPLLSSGNPVPAWAQGHPYSDTCS
ncbi:helix-turn-helix domain-containing protein [Streptomyces sp. NPDC002088]|uniref:helix-turn-helix domain-containing protein n=1 Tax=Streptomyces sp. NPDC002088 TaxID=3154665 RepID=UPI0033182371